jgi:hypothetical protein
MGHLVLAVTLAISAASCGALRASDSGSDITGTVIRYQVEYTSSPQDLANHGALSISYSTGDGQLEQKNVSLPWTKVVGTAKPGFTASVEAQLSGFGTISCRILADSKVIQSRTSAEEPYPAVQCST